MPNTAFPRFTYRVGQIVFVLTNQQHGDVIARDRTNDGESGRCPPVYDVRLHDEAETASNRRG